MKHRIDVIWASANDHFKKKIAAVGMTAAIRISTFLKLFATPL